jgi:hypothetical protein
MADLHGATVVVMRKGEVVYSRTFGEHSPESLYHIYSMYVRAHTLRL